MKASSRNRAMGAIEAMPISTMAGIAVATDANSPDACPAATPEASFMPIPVTITITTGANAAA